MPLVRVMMIVFGVAVVHASCSDCCRPGGSCGAAYKSGPGLCCGDAGQCCPVGALCVHCDYGRVRCAYPPYVGCPRAYVGTQLESIVLALVFFVCAIGMCLHVYRSLAPGEEVVAAHPVVVGHPTYGDGFATGLLGGMILSDVVHGHDEPPTYVDATFSTDV